MLIIWYNNVLEYAFACNIIFAHADQVLNLSVHHFDFLTQYTILPLQLELIGLLVLHVMPLLPDSVFKYILAHLRNEGALALGELDLRHQFNEAQFFDDLDNVKFFLDFVDALSIENIL